MLATAGGVTEDSQISHTPFTPGHYRARCVAPFFQGVGSVGVVAQRITSASARSANELQDTNLNSL